METVVSLIEDDRKVSKAYTVITEKVLAMLERGVCPWTPGHIPVALSRPANFYSERNYRGINWFWLSLMASVDGRASSQWMTFNQAKELGGSVRKGEKGACVVFFTKWTPDDVKEKAEAKAGRALSDEEMPEVACLKYYTVFNAEQIDGIEFPKVEPVTFPFSPIESAERLVAQLREAGRIPAIDHKLGFQCGGYRPGEDRIMMPLAEQFKNPAEYYCTLFHEMAHATGHENRLARKGVTESHDKRSEEYGQEELVAEMTAAFLCAHCGIEDTTIERSASYCQGWLDVIKKDVKLLVVAAAQAQKAADFLIGNVEVA